MLTYLFRKDLSLEEQCTRPMIMLKGGMSMIIRGFITGLQRICFNGISINLGPIGFNFASSSS